MIPPRFLHGFTVIQHLNVTLLAIEASLCEEDQGKTRAMSNLNGGTTFDNMRKTKNQGEVSLVDRQQGMMQIADASASQFESREMGKLSPNTTINNTVT